MSKIVGLTIRISRNGDFKAKPTGTEGDECVDIMRFFEYLPGLTAIESELGEDQPGAGCAHTQVEVR